MAGNAGQIHTIDPTVQGGVDRDDEGGNEGSTNRKPRRITAADLAPLEITMPHIPCYAEDAKSMTIALDDCPEKTKEYDIVMIEKFYKTAPCHPTCKHPSEGRMFRHRYTTVVGSQFSITEHRLSHGPPQSRAPDVTPLLESAEDVAFFTACLGDDGYFNHDKFITTCLNNQLDELQRFTLHRRLSKAIDAHICALRQARDVEPQEVSYFCSLTAEPTTGIVLKRRQRTNVPVTDSDMGGIKGDAEGPAHEGESSDKCDIPAVAPEPEEPGQTKAIGSSPKSYLMKIAGRAKRTVSRKHPKENSNNGNVETIETVHSPTPPPAPVAPVANVPTNTTTPIIVSTDKIADEGIDLVFGGDVEECWQGIYQKASRDPKELSAYDIEVRSLQWGWVHCVTDAPATVINRRVDSSTEAACRSLVDQGKGLRDQLGLKEISVPLPPSGKGMVITNTAKIKRREDGLSARARKIAEELRNNPARIRGFLAHGHTNRKWTTAVCRYLRTDKGIGPETSEIKTSVNDPVGTKNKASSALNAATKQLVVAWATKDVGPILEKKDSSENAGFLADEIIDEANDEQHSEAVYTSARSAGILTAVHHARVCIHCLLANTSSPTQAKEGKYSKLTLSELRSLNLQRLLKSDAQGYLEACAAIHNREQHALNGNIHFTAPAGITRFDAAFLAKEKAGALKQVMDTDRPTPAALLNVCENNLSKANFYTDGAKHSVLPSAQGTLHQYAYDPAIWEGILSLARDTSVTSEQIKNDRPDLDIWKRRVILDARAACTSSDDYATISQTTLLSAANNQASLDIPHYLRPRYISVHTLPSQKSDQLGLTMAATERIAASSAFASGGIGINDQRGYNIMNYVSGANLLLGTALQMATTDNLDWREIGLKAAILEACRESSMTWPTGQDWAIPRRAVPKTSYYPAIEAGIKAVVVSLNYIDACLRENNGLKVRVDGVLDHWNMNDANLRVVSLGEDTSSVELTRSLRTILALPFPVVTVMEEFELKYLGDRTDTYTTRQFYRNASLISMGDKVDRLVFIVPDKSQTSVKIAGTFRTVACPTRFNVADAVPDVWSADETLLRMLHTVMGCGRNLKVVCNDYLRKYSEAPLNWGEVQTMCGILTTRFPRQPHVYRSYASEDDENADQLQSYGLPKRVINAYGLRGYQPQDESDARTFGHSEAVTCFSQILLPDLRTCHNTCHLSIGRWSNYAEVVLTACVALFTPGSSLGSEFSNSNLRITGLDTLNRVSLLRRSVEEWASATGMAEYILNPQLHPRSTGCVEAHIVGGGNNNKIVTLRAWAATCVGGAGVSWYWNSNYERSAPLAPNHRRLGSSMYQTDYTLSFRSLDLPPRNFVSNNTIGSRGYGWAHQRGMEPSDDYEIEKFVSRLDFHKLNDWGYLQWPDGNVKREGTYRVTSTTTANLASQAGWRGFNDAYKGNWGWGVDYMRTNLETETLATLALKPATLSRVSATVFVPGLWQSIGIGLDTSVETTSSMIDRMRGFSLAAQPKDGTLMSQLEQILAVHLPTQTDGVTSSQSTTQLLDQASKAEATGIHSHHGTLPSPLPSSNPMAMPNTGTSQNTGPSDTTDQVTVNRAVPPTLKPGTDGIGGAMLDQVNRIDVN
ncbi:hypothetical protein 1 [Hubei toti-like virus 20]|uniref:Uncharacterized protein n=1 Tax=Hubei toti-like virus 20 TaxID=1923309 RepID=A0A1L3KF72_9VIRU|nr:hypothetical protein 1 [Hubei toti-like virus 20]APG75997.1 hypothetical protein 1 [Hubei toti-like virus 20]